jgi:hypothetical protein
MEIAESSQTSRASQVGEVKRVDTTTMGQLNLAMPHSNYRERVYRAPLNDGFDSNSGRRPENPLDPDRLLPEQREAIVSSIRERLEYILRFDNLIEDTYFLPLLQRRFQRTGTAYLLYDELLKCHSINAFGVYDAPAHHTFLSEALFGIKGMIVDGSEPIVSLTDSFAQDLGLNKRPAGAKKK